MTYESEETTGEPLSKLLTLDPNERDAEIVRILKLIDANRDLLISKLIPEFRDQLLDSVRTLVARGESNVESGDTGAALSAWAWFAIKAELMGRTADAQIILDSLLNTLRIAQNEVGQLHKGTPLHELGWVRARQNDLVGAEPYFRAAFAEDVIRGESPREGAAARNLKEIYLRDDKYLDSIEQAVYSATEDGRFGELAKLDPVLVSIVDEYRNRVGTPSMRLSLSYDPATARSIRRWAADAEDKGTAFELLAAYLFRSLGTYEVRGNVASIDAQHDLILRDLRQDARPLGEYVLVECKNWSASVGAREVREFAERVRSADCQSGVLLAASGVSGTGQNQFAEFAIRKIYHRDKVVIVVVSDSELEALENQSIELDEFLRSQYERIRFDEPR